MKELAKFIERTENINIEPYRCYYIPFDAADEFSYDRAKSGRFTSLNGDWNIRYYDSVYDLPEDFPKEVVTQIIPVPSCVQLHGYDSPQYVNYAYPYAFNPPYVFNENPTYHYRRTVNVSLDGDDKFLIFEGVDSCFYLFVNGDFVGYSQITHKMTEFNVTAFLKNGENVIDVLVLKWCASSYLEGQDKWRFTGIFRDVYMLSRDKTRVDDYVIVTDMSGNLSFEILRGSAANVTFNGKTKTALPGEKVFFRIEDPSLWSAETPFLYDLTVFCGEEVIYEQVGFRECEVKNGVFRFNGKPIKIYGVNRHDFNCLTGATVTIENIVEDLALMKELNVNAIRTCHYPNMPEFYKLCDRFGFYVMSEADYETHGVVSTNLSKSCYDVSAFGTISDMDFYANAIVERNISNVKCNINRPCVYMWSLGNESGWGKGLAAAAKAVRELDGTRGIHYEGVFYAGKEDYYTDLLDTASRMYPPFSFFNEFLNDERETRPLILCEYSHAMGNGPGDVCDYVNVFESNERFTGGFVWEWADHGIKQDDKFLYGGDFHEKVHDGNFCIDGIVSADRKIKRGTLEMKHAYQPIKFDYVKNYLVLFNKNFFKPLKLKVILSSDGEMVFNVEIMPRETEKIRVVGKLFFNVRAISEDGKEIANFTYAGKYIPPQTILRNDVVFSEKGRYITASFGLTEVVFDTLSGEIARMSIKGEKITNRFKFNIVRAPVDNDRHDVNLWEKGHFFTARSETRDYSKDNDALVFKGNIVGEQVCPIASYKLTYRFLTTGVEVELDYALADGFPDIPRIGFVTELPDEFTLIEYLGYEGETYVDMHESANFGYYTSFVDKEYHRYVKPQESGSHYATRKVQISNMRHSVVASGLFSFSMLPYSVEMLKSKKHDFELKTNGKNYFSIDFFMGGIGSHSCGPELQEKYKVPRKAKGVFVISVI